MASRIRLAELEPGEIDESIRASISEGKTRRAESDEKDELINELQEEVRSLRNELSGYKDLMYKALLVKQKRDEKRAQNKELEDWLKRRAEFSYASLWQR